MYFVWFDNNPKKPVGTKIDEAVLRYRQKYGKKPGICMLSEKVQVGDFTALASNLEIEVKTAKNVPQNYFWIGRDE
ncbi:hypothetical protein [Candidatus Chlorohelix sp.]|uniref:hypothetical protein n=1 Tax=Candidatus Chlorohelix sp. TaxID=3139201 RepID=UPI0030528FEC